MEQGFDRLVSAGRQLVDGVSGARPGTRSSTRPAQRSARPGERAGGPRPRLGELGRWVEDKLDWILEDEDDWREPWQEPRPGRQAPSGRPSVSLRPQRDDPPEPPAARTPMPAASARRRPLEAISRRDQRRPAAEPAQSRQSEADAWPDDTSFARPRWQRPLSDPSRAPDLSAAAARNAAARQQEAARPLPRSSRRRPG